MDREEIIQKYLHAELTDEEYDQLANMVQDDQELAEQLEIESLLYAHRNRELKSMLRKKQTAQPKLVGSVSPRNYLRVAVLLLLLCIPVFWFVQKNKPAERVTDNLWSVHLKQAFEAPAVLLDNQKIDENHWSQATRAYRENDFGNCINHLNHIAKRSDEQELYLGLSYLFNEARDAQQALKSFEMIARKPKSNFQDVALWYAALSAHEIGLEAETKRYLSQIVDSSSWKHEEARKLLEGGQ